MKTILTCIMLFAFVAVKAQSKTTLEELQHVYSTQVAWENPGELTFDPETKLIWVKNFRIPVSENSHLRHEKVTKAIFYMQKGTAVTDANDPNYRRAWFEIPFLTEEGAASFVTHFNKLKKG